MCVPLELQKVHLMGGRSWEATREEARAAPGDPRAGRCRHSGRKWGDMWDTGWTWPGQGAGTAVARTGHGKEWPEFRETEAAPAAPGGRLSPSGRALLVAKAWRHFFRNPAS